jgi:hypothetical protein
VEWLTVTLRLYRQVYARGVALATRNWPVLFTVLVYSALLSLGARLVAPLGLVGGLAMSLLFAACISSCLSLVETIIRTGKATLQDFRHSFTQYLSDVIGVTFVWWIFSMLLTPVLAQTPNGPLLLFCVFIAVFVFFNALPELIYLGRFTVVQLLRESYAFISENWIEWFPVTLFFAVAYVGLQLLPAAVPWPVQAALDGALLYLALIVRGLLFLELHGSSRRARAFRHRAR